MNYILKDENAIYYECNYSCDNAIYLSLGSESFFITDARYTVEAAQKVKNSKVIKSKHLLKSVIKLIKKSTINKIEFDPNEWSYHAIMYLKDNLPIKFSSHIDLSHKKRAIKSESEIRLLQKAVTLGENGFNKFASYLINNGLGKKESTLSFNNMLSMSHKGRYDSSFDPIVAINENASKPHALTTSKKLKINDLLLVDAGIKYKRYCSDRTRTASFDNNFSFNIEQKFKSKKIQRAYDTVRKAHDVAISKARVGMRANEIDAFARDVIQKSEFKDCFIHSTGHGVGLDIHEYPYINNTNKMIIEQNMVFTIEPGIYIDNEFGIRIEDMLYMDNNKAVVF